LLTGRGITVGQSASGAAISSDEPGHRVASLAPVIDRTFPFARPSGLPDFEGAVIRQGRDHARLIVRDSHQ